MKFNEGGDILKHTLEPGKFTGPSNLLTRRQGQEEGAACVKGAAGTGDGLDDTQCKGQVQERRCQVPARGSQHTNYCVI